MLRNSLRLRIHLDTRTLFALRTPPRMRRNSHTPPTLSVLIGAWGRFEGTDPMDLELPYKENRVKMCRDPALERRVNRVLENAERRDCSPAIDHQLTFGRNMLVRDL